MIGMLTCIQTDEVGNAAAELLNQDIDQFDDFWKAYYAAIIVTEGRAIAQI